MTQPLLFYSFKFRSAFVYYLFSDLATPRSASRQLLALSSCFLLWPRTFTCDLGLRMWPRWMPNTEVKGNLVQKLLTLHTQTHTHTRLIAISGPLKWSVNMRASGSSAMSRSVE